MPDNNQMELPFEDDSEEKPESTSGADEPMHFSQEEAGSAPTCGTCGEPIRGEVYFNHFGPAHYRCWLRETL